MRKTSIRTKRKIYHLFLFMVLLVSACQEEKCSKKSDHSLHFPDPENSVTLFFCGDVIQHLPQVYSAHNAEENDYNYLTCFKYMAPYWVASDFVIASLETTLADSNFSGYPKFCSPWQIARDLNKSGVNTFVTANNHCCDQGAKGMERTIHYLDSLGIAHAGTFRNAHDYNGRHPLYLRKNGFKIALLNYTYSTNGLPIPKGFVVSLLDTLIMKRDIQKARQDSASNIIAFVHWGDEYHTSPNRHQRELGTWLHAQGVDMVIGSHPHVVQPIAYETVGCDTMGVTVYSLGNFVSNQTFPGTDGGICVQLTLQRKNKGGTRYRMESIKCYVYRPFEEGRRKYYVVPETLADGIVKDFHTIKSKQFFMKTDSILNSNSNHFKISIK